MATVALYNGQPEAHPLLNNRGLAYGDGLFETIAYINGELRHWDAHISRLFEGCERLKIAPPDIGRLRREVLSLLDDRESAVAKIIVTRGPGGRGYTPLINAECERIVQISDWPAHVAEWQVNGISAGVCRSTLATNPQLAGLKHLNRIEQVLAAEECLQHGWDEGLMTNNGSVICGTKTNLFLVQQDSLVTPNLSNCGVAGTMRTHVLRAAEAIKVPFAEQPVAMEAMLNAESMFVSNALIGLVQVNRLMYPAGGEIATKQYAACPIMLELRRHLGV